jgi:hypothetical protein
MKSTAHVTSGSTIFGGVGTWLLAAACSAALAAESGLHDLMEHRDALETEWNSDKSAALVRENEYNGAVRLVELRKGQPARIIDLREELDDAFSAYYLKNPPAGAKGDAPSFEHRFEDWRMDGANRVAVECQVTAEFPAESQASWSARLDAIWNVKKAQWDKLEFQNFRSLE